MAAGTRRPGGGGAHGAIAAVEFGRADGTRAGVTLALRVTGVVHVLDVPGDSPGPVAVNSNEASGPSAERTWW